MQPPTFIDISSKCNKAMSATSIPLLHELPRCNRNKTIQLQYPSPKTFRINTPFPHLRIRKSFQKLGVKCVFNNNRSIDYSVAGMCTKKKEITKLNMEENLIEIFAKNIMKALRKTSVAAIAVGLLLMYDPNFALAASGGRMGGNLFSSRPSTSSGGYEVKSGSVGSDSSYSRGYTATSGVSDSSYLRDYKVKSGSGVSDFSYSVPYYGPSPFSKNCDAINVECILGQLIILLVGYPLVYMFTLKSIFTRETGASVIKLQIGLLGSGRSIQNDIKRIFDYHVTSVDKRLQLALTEPIFAVLRHPDYCRSASTYVNFKKNEKECEKEFYQLSVEEHGKFDDKTFMNVNSIKKQSSTELRANGFSNEYIVMTILVAAVGVHKLSSINNSAELEQALRRLASIPARSILVVEVSWTPRNKVDTLSEQELLEDYPLLRPL